MFDIKAIRDDPEPFDEGLRRRGLTPQSEALLKLDAHLRGIITELQEAQTERNAASRKIGQAKASGHEGEAQALMRRVADLKGTLSQLEERQRMVSGRLRDALAAIPNLPLEDVPVGEDESANAERHSHGTKPEFDFQPREHDEIGEALGLMDFETAAKLSGSRFVVLRGALARLERALAHFMLDLQTLDFGYEEVSPPALVRDEAMFGTAQLPKFAEDQFRTEDGFWLVPTAEVPLTNLAREHIWDEQDLPLRFTAHTPCFRREAGAAGRDTRGMIRLHQFNKVELVSITTPEKSAEELERMLGAAEEVLKRLGLHYRVVTLCTGDMGFAARKTYDIEVWLPGQGAYREISSCSLCGDFQARRMNARYRPRDEKTPRFVHTLNGSGLAVGRTLVAVLETCQQADGSVRVPEALVPYMNGLEVIRPQ